MMVSNVSDEPETRTILPIPDRPAQGYTSYDAKDPDYVATLCAATTRPVSLGEQ